MATVTNLLSSSQITSLIQQASAAFQLPAATLQTQETPMKAQISALGKVQGALSSLQQALAGLADVGSLQQRSVTASPNGVVQASATNSASVGSYALSNITLAHAETLISSGSSSSSGSLGSGSIAIKVGGGSTVTVNIASGSSSLSGIAAAIDQAGAGVTATVVFDGAAYHLVLAGAATGAANSFTVSGTGGLAGLGYSPTVSGSGLRQSQVATNAGFSLNGLTITSGSNKIGAVIPGVTLTLAASGSATVTVSQSTSALDNAAQGVVQALNAALGTINQETAFSATSGGGPLLGDVGLEVLRSGLLNAISAQTGGASSPYSTLSAVGFGITSSGTVTFNDSTFQTAAQSNYAAVASLFGAAGLASNPNVLVEGVAASPPGVYPVDVTSNSGGTVIGTVNGLAASGTNGVLVVNDAGSSLNGLALEIQPGVIGALGTVTISQGLFGSLSSLVNAALASGSGSVTGQISSLNSSINSMNQQITALQKEATQETQLLTAQFSAAQAALSQLTTVSSFLSSYFNQPSGGLGG
ncbi:MAG TPA: flagellar filament capping protein FliD [Stellaceae bacterium]|nr:flagellar filament capping protein FliD [Stellaceae bacterium]